MLGVRNVTPTAGSRRHRTVAAPLCGAVLPGAFAGLGVLVFGAAFALVATCSSRLHAALTLWRPRGAIDAIKPSSPGDDLVLSRHGPMSTIGEERQSNPFLA
jgi:hypothetical protein